MTIPTGWQRKISTYWPIALIVMAIVTPFLVKKSYDELRRHDQ